MEKPIKVFLKGLIAVFLVMPVFCVFAQDAGLPAVIQSEPAAGTARATSSAGSPVVTPSTSGVSAPPIGGTSGSAGPPTPSSVPTFQEPSSPPPQSEPEQSPENNTSSPNIPLVAAFIAGAAALGLGLYKMIGGQVKNDGKTDDKNKNNKCNLIKATLDAKLKELTDLEGRVKGKIKGAIKDTIEGVLLTEGEKAVLNKIEGMKGEYEKLKALYEECIADIDSGKTKTLKFRAFKADMILRGEKTSSLRLFDDKDLKAGDELALINWDTKEAFGKAKITEVIEKKLGEIGETDLLGHEPLDGGAVENLKKYYGDKVSFETTGKIIRFKLLK